MDFLPGTHLMYVLVHCRARITSLECQFSCLADLVAAELRSSVPPTRCFDLLRTLPLVFLSDLYSLHNDCSQESQSILLLLRASYYSEILRSQHQSSPGYWVMIHYRMSELVPISEAHGLGTSLT